MAMANGYAPDYSPYPHHPPPPPGLYDHTPSASASGSGSGPETRRPRLAPPAPGSFPHPGMSHPPPHQHQHPFGGPHGMSVQFPGNVAVGENEEDANRSRNARAQRRHREKRKAHVKNLEDSVISLNSQLDDARRQLAHYHGSDPRGLPPPDMAELQHLRSENMMLRDENMELRRQLGYPRGSGGSGSAGVGMDQPVPHYTPNGHMAPPPLLDDKPDGGGGMYQGEYGRPEQSPRMPDRDGHHDPGSLPSTSSGFPPPMDSMTPMSRGSRDSRVMSIGSGPGASPYITSSGTFASDPRHHSLDGRYSSSSGASSSQRYDHPYPSLSDPPPAPPHGLPRSDSGVLAADDGYPRDGAGWNNGPPPFPSSTPSYVSYSSASAQTQNPNQNQNQNPPQPQPKEEF